jgi:hypothetical protein
MFVYRMLHILLIKSILMLKIFKFKKNMIDVSIQNNFTFKMALFSMTISITTMIKIKNITRLNFLWKKKINVVQVKWVVLHFDF